MINSLPIKIVITVIGVLLIMYRLFQLSFDFFTQSPDSDLNVINFILPALISIIAAIGILVILNKSRDKKNNMTKNKRKGYLILWVVLIAGIIFSVQWQLKYINWQTSRNLDLGNILFESTPTIFCGISSLLFAIYGMTKIKKLWNQNKLNFR